MNQCSLFSITKWSKLVLLLFGSAQLISYGILGKQVGLTACTLIDKRSDAQQLTVHPDIYGIY